MDRAVHVASIRIFAVAVLLAAASAACRAQPAMACRAAPGSAPAPSGTDVIAADTPGSDGTRLFKPHADVRIDVVTRTSHDNTVRWRIGDTWDRTQASGTFPVARGSRTTSITCSTPRAGYFAFSATLASSPSTTLPSRGTR